MPDASPNRSAGTGGRRLDTITANLASLTADELWIVSETRRTGYHRGGSLSASTAHPAVPENRRFRIIGVTNIRRVSRSSVSGSPDQPAIPAVPTRSPQAGA